MRSLYIATGIIVIIVVGWLVVYNVIDSQTSELIEMMNLAIERAEEEAWQASSEQFSQAMEKWEEVRGFWTVLLDHHEVDNIDLAMERANKYIDTENKSMALVEMQVLKKLFEIVKENESLTLTNIF